jgi:hypothetical protein
MSGWKKPLRKRAFLHRGEQASIDSQLDTIWANNEALLAANGIGRENYRRFYECKRSMK